MLEGGLQSIFPKDPVPGWSMEFKESLFVEVISCRESPASRWGCFMLYSGFGFVASQLSPASIIICAYSKSALLVPGLRGRCVARSLPF